MSEVRVWGLKVLTKIRSNLKDLQRARNDLKQPTTSKAQPIIT